MFDGKRGQISVEYLIVVGFVTFIIISILAVALLYSSAISDRIRYNQISNFANKVISNAESVFFAGEPSKTTITAHLPGGVQSVTIVEDNGISLLVFVVESSSGTSTTAFPSDVPIEPGILSNSEGTKRLEIIAGLNEVSIAEV